MKIVNDVENPKEIPFVKAIPFGPKKSVPSIISAGVFTEPGGSV